MRRPVSELDVLSYLMYPKVFVEYAAFERKYTDVSMIPSDVLFYGLRIGEETEVEIERGKTLFIKLVAVSEPNEEGSRTLFFELNGHPREVQVHDARSGREAKTRLKGRSRQPAPLGVADAWHSDRHQRSSQVRPCARKSDC